MGATGYERTDRKPDAERETDPAGRDEGVYNAGSAADNNGATADAGSIGGAEVNRSVINLKLRV